MAIFHFSISNVSRGKGSSACISLAYITGEKIYDERTNTTYNFNRKERILHTGTLIPQNAPEKFLNSSILFNEIERIETADNARTAKKIQLALPKELKLDEQINIVENFIKNNLTSEGYCATYAIHDGGKNDNYHAHILVTNRALNSKGEWQSKQKMTYALDANGNRIPKLDKFGNQKTDKAGRKQWKRICADRNLLDSKDFLIRLRKNWAEEVNKHLPQQLHIDYRSNVERGLIEKPTIHEGYAARAIERKGYISERCQLNRDIKISNLELKSIHQALNLTKSKSQLLDNFQSQMSSPNFNLTPLINSAINFVSNLKQDGIASLQGNLKTDYAEKLQNAQTAEEIAKILAEIESEQENNYPTGNGLFFDSYLAELEQQKKEQELDERYKKFKQRRRNVGGIGKSTSGERKLSVDHSRFTDRTGEIGDSVSIDRNFSSESQQSTSRDYIAEFRAFQREESEREIARISKKREDVTNREQPTQTNSATKEQRNRELETSSTEFSR